MKRLTCLALAFTLGPALLACDAPLPGLHEIDDPDAPPPVWVEECTVEAVWASPADGAQNITRTSPLVIHHPGTVDDVTVVIRAPKAGVLGADVYVGATRTVAAPWGAWPANTELRWTAALCDQVYSGRFVTGALLRAPDERLLKDVYLDEPFSLDTRVGLWSGSVVDGVEDDVEAAAFRWRFGPSLLVTMREVTQEDIALRLAPAVADSAGTYEQDTQGRTFDLRVPRSNAAYLELGFAALEVTVRGQPIVLRETRMTLGLGADGYEDGAMYGQMDLRDYESDGHSGCDLADRLVNTPCEPCAFDGELSCIPFAVTGLAGLPAPIDLDPMAPLRP
jgi:hypothetical protein